MRMYLIESRVKTSPCTVRSTIHSFILPCYCPVFFHFPLSLRSGLLIKKSSNQICV